MSVSKRLRFEIFNRDNNACRYCGGSAPDVKLTIDHVIPVSLGGSDKPDNLVAACADCNAGKTSSNPDAPLIGDVSDRAIAWAAAMVEVADSRRAERSERTKIHRAFSRYWNGFDGFGQKRLPNGWEQSIDQLMSAGLDLDDLKEMTRAAMARPAKDKWRYFCGCCWHLVRDSTRRAASILATTEEGFEGKSDIASDGIDFEDYDDYVNDAFHHASQRAFTDFGVLIPGCDCQWKNPKAEFCGRRGCVALCAGRYFGLMHAAHHMSFSAVDNRLDDQSEVDNAVV